MEKKKKMFDKIYILFILRDIACPPNFIIEETRIPLGNLEMQYWNINSDWRCVII